VCIENREERVDELGDGELGALGRVVESFEGAPKPPGGALGKPHPPNTRTLVRLEGGHFTGWGVYYY